MRKLNLPLNQQRTGEQLQEVINEVWRMPAGDKRPFAQAERHAEGLDIRLVYACGASPHR
jgi:hypothetical protein